MLVIRNTQKEILAEVQRLDFEERMAAHLKEAFAEATRNMRDNELRALIRLGIQRAGQYGIRREMDVARYLHLMLGLSPLFDTDPRYRWAREILISDLPPEDKVDRLCERVQFGSGPTDL